ncbi:MAG: hypothetical protein RL732_1010 [Bacteroidota bacterium]|jgi:hypothetical protein
MRSLILLNFFIAASMFTFGQQSKVAIKDPSKPVQTVEASCGQCQFGLKGKGCDLAVRLGGKAYYVSGTAINDHGDAHDKEGFCNAIRKADVQGTLVKNKFVVTYFKLLPTEGSQRP